MQTRASAFFASHSSISALNHPTEFPPNTMRLGNLPDFSILQIVASDKPILEKSSGFLITLDSILSTSLKKNALQASLKGISTF
jgi:hypothetical protein